MLEYYYMPRFRALKKFISKLALLLEGNGHTASNAWAGPHLDGVLKAFMVQEFGKYRLIDSLQHSNMQPTLQTAISKITVCSIHVKASDQSLHATNTKIKNRH